MKAIIDTHVHFYPQYDLRSLLECTWENLNRLAPDAVKCIFLTERFKENYFERMTAVKSVGLYKVLPTKETASVVVALDSNRSLLVIHGRQYTSAEGIEVLAIGEAPATLEKLPIHEIIHSLTAGNGTAIVPWSFGKWTFRRRRVLKSLFSDTSLSFFLGDIQGHASIFGGADLFELARRSGHCVLWGTDPLPIPGEEKIAGTLATELDGDFDLDFPCQTLRTLLFEGQMRGYFNSASNALFRQLKLRAS